MEEPVVIVKIQDGDYEIEYTLRRDSEVHLRDTGDRLYLSIPEALAVEVKTQRPRVRHFLASLPARGDLSA